MKAWLFSMAALAGFLVVSYLVVTFLFPFLAPFVLAAVLAQLIEPVVGWLEAKGRLPRGLVVGVLIAGITGGLVFLMVVGISFLVHEIRLFAAGVPYYYALALDLSNQLAERLGTFDETLPASMHGLTTTFLDNVQATVTRQLPGMVEALMAFTGVPLLLVNLVIALIATFFLSRDRREIYAFILSLMPGDLRPKVREVKVEVWASAMRFAKAMAILVALTMVMTIIGLSVIGSKYYVSLGLLVGLADVLPLIGPAAVFFPWIAYHFIFGTSAFGLKLLILYVIVTLVRQVLEAKVVGEQIGLHPLGTLFSLFLGFQFFGAWGFVIGPLLAILLKAMIKSGLLPIFQEESKAQ